MAGFLAGNPEAYITVSPELYETREKEQLLFFEAKKKYFLKANNKNANGFSVADSMMADKLSVKDSSFVHYLNRQVKSSMQFTVQDKCAKLVDPAIIDSKMKDLNIERASTFMSYFRKLGVEKQVHMRTARNVTPFNGFSFYEIGYKGEFPRPLINAYHHLNELNEEMPRKKFEKERKKNKSAL